MVSDSSIFLIHTFLIHEFFIYSCNNRENIEELGQEDFHANQISRTNPLRHSEISGWLKEALQGTQY